MHTEWSDGSSKIIDMALEAQKMAMSILQSQIIREALELRME